MGDGWGGRTVADSSLPGLAHDVTVTDSCSAIFCHRLTGSHIINSNTSLIYSNVLYLITIKIYYSYCLFGKACMCTIGTSCCIND